MHYSVGVLQILCLYTILLNAVPTTLLENTKVLKLHGNKVKRNPYQTVQSDYFNAPSAKKRDGGQNLDLYSDLPTWEPENDALQQEALQRMNPDLYADDEKTLGEYEKGFHYGTNKEKLDEQMENAILKSEIYGDPTSMNQYRYYGREDNRRKRSFRRVTPRLKREIDGNPDDDLFDLISLWEAQRKYNKYNHNNPAQWQRNHPEYQDDEDESDSDEDDENWLEAPVYPTKTGRYLHTPQLLNLQSPYYYNMKNAYPLQKRQWAGFGDRRKRFMVARKRSDPTRELRYFTGPSHGDNIYTLAQLLGNTQQRDPNIPLYHRTVL